MATSEKLSISLPADELRWVRARARRKKTSVSALVGDAVRAYRELEARREFLAKLEPEERATDADAAAIRKEWKGSRSTRAR